MNIIAITSCATGIAHSYMAAEAIKKAATAAGHQIKVEIQGALGIEDELSAADIKAAERIVFANDVRISKIERFDGLEEKIKRFSPHEVIKNATIILE